MRVRRKQDGPEADLVAEFMRRLVVEVPRGCKYTVFREPHLECGVPDIVVAVWHMRPVEQWVNVRAEVTRSDLRLLQYLFCMDGASDDELRDICPKGLNSALIRLVEARLVRRWGGEWHPMSLERSFALRRLIAVEAKIGDWSGAVQQAMRNTWFACESYVLMPSLVRPKRAERRPPPGVGVFCPEDTVIRVTLEHETIVPRCYASWLFNEWVLRAENETAQGSRAAR